MSDDMRRAAGQLMGSHPHIHAWEKIAEGARADDVTHACACGAVRAEATVRPTTPAGREAEKQHEHERQLFCAFWSGYFAKHEAQLLQLGPNQLAGVENSMFVAWRSGYWYGRSDGRRP